jgi:hypothetical protein
MHVLIIGVLKSSQGLFEGSATANSLSLISLVPSVDNLYLQMSHSSFYQFSFVQEGIMFFTVLKGMAYQVPLAPMCV